MEIGIEPIKGKSQVKVKIAASASEFEPYLEKSARQISKQHPIKGFRPGKASLKAIVDAFGQEAVINQALEKAIPKLFVEAVLEHDIEALGRPATTITKATLAEGLEFESTVDVMPEVTLGDTQKIKAEKRKVEVTDEKVTEELQYLAKMRSTYLEITRPAEKGDTVTVDFQVKMDGKTIENGESKNHPVHLGEGHFVPGFEDKLLGIKAGEERTFEIQFPKDYAKEELRGQKATIEAKAQAVQKRVLPELNDEFAHSLGKFESMEALRKELKQNLITEKEQREIERLRGEIVEKLVKTSRFSPLPESLIESEIDRRLYELAQTLSYQQKTLEDYLQSQKKTLQDLRSELKEPAIEAVKSHLVVRKAAEQAKIEADEAEVGRQIDQYMSRYRNVQQAAAEVDAEELRRQVTASVRSQKTLEWLQSQAQIQDKK